MVAAPRPPTRTTPERLTLLDARGPAAERCHELARRLPPGELVYGNHGSGTLFEEDE